MQEFKAYAASGPKGPLEPFSFDLGPLGPEEVEIKVGHCGLCHSDLSMLDNEWGMSQYPFVPGHDVTGTVVEALITCTTPRKAACSKAFPEART